MRKKESNYKLPEGEYRADEFFLPFEMSKFSRFRVFNSIFKYQQPLCPLPFHASAEFLAENMGVFAWQTIRSRTTFWLRAFYFTTTWRPTVPYDPAVNSQHIAYLNWRCMAFSMMMTSVLYGCSCAEVPSAFLSRWNNHRRREIRTHT